MDKGISGSKPVGHLLGEAFDPDARLIAEGSFELSPEGLVTAAQADNEIYFGEGEGNLHGDRDPPDSPPTAGNEDDFSPDRQTERRPRIVLLPRLTKGRIRKAVDAMCPSGRTRDLSQLLDRLAVRDEVDIGARGGPVPKGGEVGHRSTQGHAQAAATT